MPGTPENSGNQPKDNVTSPRPLVEKTRPLLLWGIVLMLVAVIGQIAPDLFPNDELVMQLQWNSVVRSIVALVTFPMEILGATFITATIAIRILAPQG